LGTAEFVYNNKVHSLTKVSPFKANYRQDSQMGFEIRKEKYEGAKRLAKKMQKIQEEAKMALGKSQEKIKKYANRKKGEVNKYRVGDLVMLSTKV